MGPLSDDRQPESHDDDADVLDAVIGEKTLEVVLADGEDDACHAAHRAQRQKKNTPDEWRVRQHRQHPHDRIDTGLDDDAREHGGNVAGCVRVSRGEPDMQRHDAGLDAESHERGQEEPALRPGPRRCRAPSVQIERPAHGAKPREDAEKQDEADVRGGEIHPTRVPHLARSCSVVTRKNTDSVMTSNVMRKGLRRAPRRGSTSRRSRVRGRCARVALPGCNRCGQ